MTNGLLNLILTLAIQVSIFGCSPIGTGSSYYSLKETTRSNSVIYPSALVADLKVDPRRYKVTLKGASGEGLSVAKDRALDAFKRSTGADLVIEPLYRFTQVGMNWTIGLSAYVGTFSRPRTMTKDDAFLIDQIKKTKKGEG